MPGACCGLKKESRTKNQDDFVLRVPGSGFKMLQVAGQNLPTVLDVEILLRILVWTLYYLKFVQQGLRLFACGDSV